MSLLTKTIASLCAESSTISLPVIWVIGAFIGPIFIGIVGGATNAEDLNARTSYGVTISEATNIDNVNLAIVPVTGMVVVVLADLIIIIVWQCDVLELRCSVDVVVVVIERISLFQLLFYERFEFSLLHAEGGPLHKALKSIGKMNEKERI
jgi:hypothetical protein